MIDRIAEIVNEITETKFKILCKMNTLCSNDKLAYVADCRVEDSGRVKTMQMNQEQLARQVASGNTLMEAKTIYNIKGKSTEQVENILMFVQEEFAAAHSQYEYSDLKYEDGKNGERTYYLMFKRKAGA